MKSGDKVYVNDYGVCTVLEELVDPAGFLVVGQDKRHLFMINLRK